MMELDDPKRDHGIEEFFQQLRLRRSLKTMIDPIGARVDELTRENDNTQTGRSSAGANCQRDT